MASQAIGNRRDHSHGGKVQPMRPRPQSVVHGEHPVINWSLSGPGVAQRFGMDEHSIAQRREYIRLSEEDRAGLAELVPWIASVAPEISKAFYDWQFAFGPTREFFENFALAKGIPLPMLRERLEVTHTSYLVEIFAGAEINWDLRYFEKRLRVQTAHDRIELPFKWFVGAYAEFTRLIGERLRRDFRDHARVYRIEAALQKVFNLDIQAMADAATLNTLEGMLKSIGLGLADAGRKGDKTEQTEALKKLIGDQIVQLTSSMENMVEEQEKGDLDAAMPVESFMGSFRVLAEKVNQMRAQHILIVRKIMACVAEFARGNFDAPLEKFPGKRAFINEEAERLRRNLQSFLADTDSLTAAAAGGNLSSRADVTKHPGDFARIVEGINRTLDAVVERVHWYQSIIDAVPFPVHVIDKDMKWVFLNKAFEKLMVDQGHVRDRDDAVGRPCSTASANICQTDKCGIMQLRKGNGESFFDWCGMSCKQDTSNLVNIQGQHVGYVEVVQDLSATLSSKDYTTKEVDRLAANLAQIARGDLNFDLKTQDASKYTIQVKEQFEKINSSLAELKRAIAALISDSDSLVNAAVEGKLSTRADAAKHPGDFGKIVGGINRTLDAVIRPLQVTAEYVRRIAAGDIPPKITDNYNGDFNEIKEDLNTCIDALSGLLAEMKHMSDDHNRGEIDAWMPVEKFDGEYKTMAQGVNGMVAGHIAVKRKAMACVAEFGKGNFEAPLEKFPGKKAFINETIERLRTNLQSFIAEMKRMSEEHNKGDIDVSIPVEKFEGDYKTMAQGVNDMVAGHIAVKKKAMACVAEFGKGNFKAPLERFPGKKAFINDAIEGMRTNLTALISETSENSSTLASSAEELTAVSQQMAGTAEETATQANVVSAASEQISRNVATVASSSEQMQASIREIAKNANESARVAKNAVSVAHSTNETMKKLGDSSQEIGNVIKVITSIAQQTNLLALNATIEAARAGEAGKGFAVVANEVKELAKQTAKATEEIGKKIETIQGDTTGAVKAIGEIGSIIDQINEISNSIASAVEEQTVTTNEIGRSVAEAAKGVGDIAKNISGVAVAAKSTTEGAAETQKASVELSHMAARLQTALSKFTV